MRSKVSVRKYISEQRKSLDEDTAAALSRRIFERLLAREWYKTAGCIFTYYGCNGEVKTDLIIKDALSRGKEVALPRVAGRTMDFFYINSLDDLIKGYMGIPEPAADRPACDADPLMIMPGVAFDLKLNRIGYGGGFYDRYLADRNFGKKAALAYEFQIFESIESSETDIKPDILITEKKVYERNGNNI